MDDRVAVHVGGRLEDLGHNFFLLPCLVFIEHIAVCRWSLFDQITSYFNMRETTMQDIAEVNKLKKELRSVKKWYAFMMVLFVVIIVFNGWIMRTMQAHPNKQSCLRHYATQFNEYTSAGSSSKK